MGETLSGHVDTDQVEAIQEMVEAGEADNQSEAIRRALRVGLSEMGYHNGVRTDTQLRTVARRFRDAFLLLGVLWVGVSFWLPIGWRSLAAAPVAAGLACHVIDRGLARREPDVSNRLRALVGGETA